MRSFPGTGVRLIADARPAAVRVYRREDYARGPVLPPPPPPPPPAPTRAVPMRDRRRPQHLREDDATTTTKLRYDILKITQIILDDGGSVRYRVKVAGKKDTVTLGPRAIVASSGADAIRKFHRIYGSCVAMPQSVRALLERKKKKV
jgi:hypothetical protein